MTIRLIGEKHNESEDIAFRVQAKNIAKDGKIFLFLESQYFQNVMVPEGPRIDGVEDRVIDKYVQILLGLYYIYFLVRKLPRFLHLSLLDVYERLSEQEKSEQDERLDAYMGTHYSILKNIFSPDSSESDSDILKEIFEKSCEKLKTENSSFWKDFLDAVDLSVDADKRRKFFRGNIETCNRVLCCHACELATHVNGSEKYSELIRNHFAINNPWISDYFSFQHVRPTQGGGKLLNCDDVIVSLRNQLFLKGYMCFTKL